MCALEHDTEVLPLPDELWLGLTFNLPVVQELIGCKIIIIPDHAPVWWKKNHTDQNRWK